MSHIITSTSTAFVVEDNKIQTRSRHCRRGTTNSNQISRTTLLVEGDGVVVEGGRSGGGGGKQEREKEKKVPKSAMLSKELAEKALELRIVNLYAYLDRQMKGEDLQGLDLKGLDKLEAMLESGLVQIVKTKGERILKEISTLKKKMMDTSIGQTDIHDNVFDHHSLELTITA
ncbi:hypothetical protein OSB04_un001500 [Centaurea solstitialis]|uniref:K-box domain-containing protein n=1 Tax=Centaurea solstitialis TaxID=347529 RepID=A0AA38W1N3_9ASTR|nr:hypothetical protein OSB04_un001500 [Centaurea solstitialis]